MNKRHLIFIYPGDLNTRTGGYLYDKRLLQELDDSTFDDVSWKVTLLSLQGDYPFPDKIQRKEAAKTFP